MLLPFIGKTVVDMVEKWDAMADAVSGDVEIDVSEWFQIVTEDAITRTAFGRSYEDGKAVFKLQTQLMTFASEAFRKVFIPGYRYLISHDHCTCDYLILVNTLLINNLACAYMQVLADQEEHELMETGQGDQEEPGDAHRPAAGGHG
jgi:hypothetical protein